MHQSQHSRRATLVLKAQSVTVEKLETQHVYSKHDKTEVKWVCCYYSVLTLSRYR